MNFNLDVLKLPAPMQMSVALALSTSDDALDDDASEHFESAEIKEKRKVIADLEEAYRLEIQELHKLTGDIQNLRKSGIFNSSMDEYVALLARREDTRKYAARWIHRQLLEEHEKLSKLVNEHYRQQYEAENQRQVCVPEIANDQRP